MSVRTTADEKLQDARDKIKQAYQSLLDFLNTETWGNSDYDEAFIKMVHEAAMQLIELKGKL